MAKRFIVTGIQQYNELTKIKEVFNMTIQQRSKMLISEVLAEDQ